MKRSIQIPLPYHLTINLFVRKSLAKLILKGVSEEQKGKYEDHKEDSLESKKVTKEWKSTSLQMGYEWIEALDFAELRESLHGLRTYKGMALVDVHSADGDIVKIII